MPTAGGRMPLYTSCPVSGETECSLQPFESQIAVVSDATHPESNQYASMRSLPPPNSTPLQIVIHLRRLQTHMFQHFQSKHEMLHSMDFQLIQQNVSLFSSIPFPENNYLFLVNLFNLMVTQAFICWNPAHQNWHSFIQIVQYQFMNRQNVSLAYITAQLLTAANARYEKHTTCGSLWCSSPFFQSQSKSHSTSQSHSRPTLSDDALFPLMCSRGTKSSPSMLHIFETDADLAIAACTFIRSHVSVTHLEQTTSGLVLVRVPQMFESIFGGSVDEMMEWLVNYLDGPQMALLAEYIGSYGQNVRVCYQSFDWTCCTLNEVRALNPNSTVGSCTPMMPSSILVPGAPMSNFGNTPFSMPFSLLVPGDPFSRVGNTPNASSQSNTTAMTRPVRIPSVCTQVDSMKPPIRRDSDQVSSALSIDKKRPLSFRSMDDTSVFTSPSTPS